MKLGEEVNCLVFNAAIEREDIYFIMLSFIPNINININILILSLKYCPETSQFFQLI
jgi:hypothetical protein